jgi:hypothetical protein
MKKNIFKGSDTTSQLNKLIASDYCRKARKIIDEMDEDRKAIRRELGIEDNESN